MFCYEATYLVDKRPSHDVVMLKSFQPIPLNLHTADQNLRHPNPASSRMRRVAEHRAWRDTDRCSRGVHFRGVLG